MSQGKVDPKHPITVTPFKGEVTVKTHSGETIVDTRNALELREASYPPVYYLPRADTKMAALERTSHSTHCPYKGDASYYSVGGESNAVWTYETPFDLVAPIKDSLAFYPSKLTITATPD
jgi:uncharacterized protein (DUF427 family)